MELAQDFLTTVMEGNAAKFTLPNGKEARGKATYVKRDEDGNVLQVQGVLTQPEAGDFFFQRQTIAGKAGEMVGSVQFDKNPVAWRLEPGANGGTELVEHQRAAIFCSVPDSGPTPMSAFDAHPTNMTQPTYQAVQPLTSLPGAQGVIYLDFDGGTGPFPGWGQGNPNFNVAPSGASNAQIFEVWQRVAEDYAPFNVSVTTDVRVYENAAQGHRIRAMITPTNTAYPFGAGNAFVGSFNWTGDPTCWIYNTSGKNCAEAVTHEVGHSLGLLHHGRTSPVQTYYQGGGTGAVSWAPIMGNANAANLGHWSHGEYANANNSGQDDLLIIATQNNDVDYRADDFGATLATAGYLNIKGDNTVSSEGVIEQRTDVDAFRFTTTGGAVSLHVSPASTGPNLDVLAELVDAGTGTVIDSDNGLDVIDATVTATLPAGEYLLKVSGVGRGDPAAADGYSDYSSLGTFTITGSVAGGTKADEFTVAENSAVDTALGTVAPRVNHGSNDVSFSLSGGSGAFAIDSATGALTVANAAALDYESVSTKWDDAPTFELLVSIVDAQNSGLNETVRVVVSLTNVNEAPTAVDASVTILEHSVLGTKLTRVTASDVDAFDFPSFAIAGGNEAGLFAIDQLGQVILTGVLDLASDEDYALEILISDQGTPALTTTATVSIHAVAIEDGFEPGKLTRTFYNNISGATVASLVSSANFPETPTREESLTQFRGELVSLGSFGDTIKGCLIPPTTGDYQFWIAGDDATELWLSSSSDPAGIALIAYSALPTAEFDWGASPTQTSAVVTLQAGTAYFIEARHKQDNNVDHIAVAWTGPGISQEIIPGRFLAACYHNYAPHPVATTFSVRENAIIGASVGVVTSFDVNAEDTVGNYQILSGNTGGAFAIDAATGKLTVAAAGVLNATTTPTYTLTISSTDNGTPALTGNGTITVNVQSASLIGLNGIVQQRWLNLPGASIATLTSSPNYPFLPDNTRLGTDSEFASANLDSFGSRVRFLVTPPTTGTYNFYLSGDQVANLYVSTNATPSNAALAASVPSATGFRSFLTFPSQKSANMSLVAGQKYYLEVLHKEDTGSDSVSIAWTGPGIATPSLLGAANIAPYDINTAPSFTSSSYTWPVALGAANGTVVGTTVAVDPEADAVTTAIISGNVSGASHIDGPTGVISVANAAQITAYTVFNLQVSVQDSGIGGVYPLKSATVPVTIYVNSTNVAPVWTANPTVKSDATATVAYTGVSLAGSTTDLNFGDTANYAKVSGPAWLSVASNGTLTGTPGSGDVGLNSWTVRVTDSGGLSADATLQITVLTSPGVQAPWSAGDFGTTGQAGSTVVSGTGFSQSGAGIGVNAKADAGQFLKQSLMGNGELRAQISSLTGVSTGMTGVMLRDSTAVNSRTVFFGIKGGNFILSSRTGTNTNSTTTTVAAQNAAPNNWVRLTRSGNTINAYRSFNGTTWTPSGTLSISFGTNIQVGQFTASGNTSSLVTGVTQNVSVTPFPSPWTTTQIGTVTARTSAEFYNSIYTVNGAGTVGGTADVGTYMNQTLTGDGQIIARLSSIQNTGANARFGVVMRDTTAAGARGAFMGISADGTFRFQYRTATNGSTTTVTGGTGTAPNYWVKLVRSGSTFTGYKSADGVTWTSVGSASVTIGASATFGSSAEVAAPPPSAPPPQRMCLQLRSRSAGF